MRTHELLGGVLVLACFAAGCDEGDDDPRAVEQRADGQGWFPIAGKMQLVYYSVVDGQAILDGDVVLGEVDDFTAVELGEREPDRGAAIPERKWPNGTLYYTFEGLPEAHRQAALAGIAMLAGNTQVSFVERTNEPDYVAITYVPKGGCLSPIGRQGGRQQVTLGDGCQAAYIVAHELMHALGIYHEQSRSDRDQYVTIHWDNIPDEEERNFKTFLEMGGGVNLGPYDFASVMHYGPTDFGIDGKTTISRKDGGVIAKNKALSAGDINTINSIYVAGPWQCGNGVIEATEQCDFGGGNEAATLYWGGDGSTCGDDFQEVCEAGCGKWLTLTNGGLDHDCDIHDWCSEGLDCWMSSTTGGCECSARCGNGWVEAGEACDYGDGNRTAAIYLGGDGSSCGWDAQSVCDAGCGAELTRENGGLGDCDAYDDCSVEYDCWMGWDGGCACNV